MALLLPLLIFLVVFAGVLLVSRRSQRTVLQLDRHQIVGVGGKHAAVAQVKTPILGIGPQSSSLSELALKAARPQARTKAGKLLREAGDPMSLARFFLLRAVCTFVVMPLFVLYMYGTMGFTALGVPVMAVAAFAIPNLPMLRIKRKARKRAKSIEQAMPDALDLLVVCVEGGQSLDGGLQQVANRTAGELAAELRRLQSEIATGMARRDAFIALAARAQSESLPTFCTTIVQADKMGMSIGTTLRTLTETMRTRRRQLAETQARKAPLKMMPCIIFFMIPSLFIVILTPAILSAVSVFRNI